MNALDVWRNKSEDEIRAEIERLYREGMKRVHPDLQKPEDRDAATKKAQLLNKIHDSVKVKK
jgi:hypothetical protein